MKSKLIAVFILLSAVIFTGCEKDNGDDDNTPKTKTELISASVWKYDNAKIDLDNNGTGDMDVPAGYIQACQKDNTLTFNANGTGSIDEGPTKCDSNDPQTYPFTWMFTSNETVINFTAAIFAGVGGEFKLVSLTETELKLSKLMTDPGTGASFVVIASFKH